MISDMIFNYVPEEVVDVQIGLWDIWVRVTPSAAIHLVEEWVKEQLNTDVDDRYETINGEQERWFVYVKYED